jgi:hypothetical protein
MKRNNRIRMMFATVVLAGLPLVAAAQPPAQQPPPTQPPATQPPPQVPPAMPTEPAAQTAAQPPSSDGAMVLLNRISELLEQSLGNSMSTKDEMKPKGTSGVKPRAPKSSAGVVSVDRATLDEIHAEVDQLKIMLAPKPKQ